MRQFLPSFFLDLMHAFVRYRAICGPNQTSSSRFVVFSTNLLKMSQNKQTDSPFEVFSSPAKGLGLKAARSFAPGQTVLTESAICHVLTKEKRGQRCDFCLQNSVSLLKCSQCKFRYYCGVSCQRKDWILHKQECKFLLKVQPKRPPDICLLASRFMLKLLKLQPKIRARKLEKIIKFYNNIAEKNDIIDGKRKEMLFTFAFVLQQFVDEKTFADLNLKTRHSFGVLCWLSCNCFTILNDEMVSVGIGIYDDASLINHSCRPNCIAMFDCGAISIRAIRNISKDEEITISYIECLQTTKERRIELADRYFFECKCSRCEQGDREDREILKCRNCGQQVNLNAESLRCECGFSDFPKTGYCDIDEELKTAMENYKKDTTILQNTLKSLPQNSVMAAQCCESLFNSCIEHEKWELAFKYGLILLQAYEEYYEDLHPSTGIHLFKLGKIQLFLENLRDGVDYLERAKRILFITHGRNNRLTEALQEMLAQAKTEINQLNSNKALEDGSIME